MFLCFGKLNLTEWITATVYWHRMFVMVRRLNQPVGPEVTNFELAWRMSRLNKKEIQEQTVSKRKFILLAAQVMSKYLNVSVFVWVAGVLVMRDIPVDVYLFLHELCQKTTLKYHSFSWMLWCWLLQPLCPLLEVDVRRTLILTLVCDLNLHVP